MVYCRGKVFVMAITLLCCGMFCMLWRALQIVAWLASLQGQPDRLRCVILPAKMHQVLVAQDTASLLAGQ